MTTVQFLALEPAVTARPWRRAHHRGFARTGFTLAELIVTIAVFGLMAMLAAPKLDYQRYRVNASVRAIASALNHAGRQAISLQHDVRVAFDTTGRRLRVHEDANNDGVLDPGERVTYVELGDGIQFGRAGAAPASFGAAAIAFTRTQGTLPVVIFRRDGSASETGGFYLTTRRDAATGGTHDARAIEMVRATGRALWYAFDGAAWQRGN